MLGLAILSEPFVATMYGPKWLPMVPTLRVLALAGMLQGMGTPAGWLYLSQGRTDLQLRWGLIATPVYVCGILLGLSFGSITTVAVGYSVASCLLMYPGFSMCGRVVGLSFVDVFKAVLPNGFCALIMGLVVFSAMIALRPLAPPVVLLSICIIIGTITYGGLAVFFELHATSDLRQILTSQAS